MSEFLNANLIRVFSFYLMVMLLVGLVRRWSFYRDTLWMLIAVRGRWPKLLERMAANKDAVLNWPTLRPMVIALSLMLVQLIASRGLWPQATISLANLLEVWWHLLIVVAAAIPMLAVDLYFVICVGRFDREQTAEYLDYAERWAGSWRANAVRLVTFGKINPEKMVDEQVREGLKNLGVTMGWAMWWVVVQASLRLALGLTIWLLWALG
jgi:hypothetical protein